MKKFLLTFFSFLCMQTLLLGLDSEMVVIGHIYPSSKSLISTQVAGRVDAIYVEVGSLVKKGQPLVQLDKRFYAIDLTQKGAAFEEAKIELSDAEKNFLRMQKLWEKPEGVSPTIPLKRFEDAKTKYEQAMVQARQAQENFNKAKLSLEESTIRAPYDGIITKKFVDIGDSIPSQPVTNMIEIQTHDPVYLEFSIPQIYCDKLQIGSAIQFEIEGIELTNKTATIDLFYPTLDETTHALRCRAVLNHPEKVIRPGSLVKVKLALTSTTGVF